VKLAQSLAERILAHGQGLQELGSAVREATAAEDTSVAAEAEVALAESNVTDLDGAYAQVERDIRIAVVDLRVTVGQLEDDLVRGSSQDAIADLKNQIVVLERNLAGRHQETAARLEALEAEVAARQETLGAAHRAQTEAESRLIGALLRARPSPVPWALRQDFATMGEMLRTLRSL
jgi:hypothetical protein